jgi:hypothetical protein
MKLRRLAAAATTLLIAGVGVFASSSAAQADDFYVTAAQLTATETDPYPAGWFKGDVVGTPGTFTSEVDGLNVVGGQFQLLNGSPGAIALTSADPGLLLSSGVASFQIPVFAGAGDTVYTTLYADAAGIGSDTWFTSQNLNGLAGADGTFGVGTTHTLAQYQAAFDIGYRILAFGFNKTAGDEAAVAALWWNGNSYYFLPTATIALGATSITPAAITATGTTITATGFIPGEHVYIYFTTPAIGDLIEEVVADANGVARTTLIGDMGVGAYTIGADGDVSGVIVETTLTIAEQLPTMGTDSVVPAIGAGIMLLGGIAAVVFAVRRRQSITA